MTTLETVLTSRDWKITKIYKTSIDATIWAQRKIPKAGEQNFFFETYFNEAIDDLIQENFDKVLDDLIH